MERLRMRPIDEIPQSLPWKARPIKHRTRHLLPLEMLLACVLVILGVTGGFGRGALAHALQARGENGVWAAILLTLGIVWLSTALIEWCAGQGWEEAELRAAIWIRMWCAFFGGGSWAIVGYVLLEARGIAGSLLVLSMLAPVHMIFCAWSWWINYRTETLLDPNLDTSRLERKLENSRVVRW